MKIGLISDTHDNIQNIRKAISLFSNKNVSFVIHAGDIVSPEAVEAFQGVKLIAVLGNNDLEINGLTKALDKIGGQLNGEFCEMEHDDLIFAIYHGTNSRKKELLIRSGRYNVVVCGHTHKMQYKKFGRTLVINPGTANGWFFGYNATAAIFDTQIREPEFLNL
ncbi:MAG TPA: metallophosphoesterase [Nitrososphaeraceae archaeon]|nr:metallophosphoesterase [Nitrososphaeraceae archaeon]